MTTRLLFVLAVASMLAIPAPARAVPRDDICPPGTVWNTSAGSCKKKVVATKIQMAPQKKFELASDDVEGRGKAPDPKRGVGLLEEACNRDSHPASCNLLGFLYTRGRHVAKDDKRALDYYVKSCNLKDLEGCFYIGDLHYRTGAYALARAAFLKACDMGGGVACTRGGELFENGTGGAKDAAKALDMYKRSMGILNPLCPGDGPACFIVGFLHENGKGTPKDAVKAIVAYKAGCTAGAGNACTNLAIGLDAGLGGKVDTDGANVAYEKSCNDFDNAAACQKISERLGQAKRDLPRAFKMAQRGCDLDLKYCGTAGEFYRLGFGMAAPDQVTATRYYKQSCENGELGWCQRFGERAHDGIGMAKDFAASQAALERACTGEYNESCDVAAQYLQDADKSLDRALTLATMGCDQKWPRACWRAGMIVAGGKAGAPSPERAFAFYERGCTMGSPSSCDELADSYRSGKGTTKDPAKALEAYKKGCDGDKAGAMSPSACKGLGNMVYLGEGTPKDVKLALTSFARACEHGQTDMCQYLFSVNAEAGGKREDVAKPLQAACKASYEDACIAYGNFLAASDTETDKRAAYAAFEASCGRKSDAGCLRQADFLSEGFGITKDAAKAEQLYKPRCDANIAGACFGLARLYESTGKHDESQTLFIRACEGGDGNACNNAAYRFYTATKGTKWDIAAAVKYYNKSCELGTLQGCANVAETYRYGAGVKLDHKKAFELYDKSCRALDTSGCTGLGHYLATGEGGTKVDLKRAEEVLRSACTDRKSPEACRDLADLLEAQKKGSMGEIARLRTTAFTQVQELAKDNPSYMWVLGTFYANGIATMKDPKQAVVWYSKACDSFDPTGCLDAGKALRTSKQKDETERARVYLERACAAGMDEGCSTAKLPTTATPHGCCGGEVAPGAELGMALLGLALLRRRRRAMREPRA